MAIKSNEAQRDAAGQRQNRGQHHKPCQWLDDFFHDDSWGSRGTKVFLIAESVSKTRAMPGGLCLLGVSEIRVKKTTRFRVQITLKWSFVPCTDRPLWRGSLLPLEHEALPKPVIAVRQIERISRFTAAAHLSGTVRRSDKLPRHKGGARPLICSEGTPLAHLICDKGN